MDESSQKKRNFDAMITAINIAAMGAGIAVAVVAASKSKASTAETGDVIYVRKSSEFSFYN